MSLQVQLLASADDPDPFKFELDDETVDMIDSLVGSSIGRDRAAVIKNILQTGLGMEENSGPCDMCGLYDTRLRRGMCPACRLKYPSGYFNEAH